MRCFIFGKCPPIQGGTSNQTFMFARDMVERGHQVDFITNSPDATNNYKSYFDKEDEDLYKSYAEGITVHSPSTLLAGTYIPFSSAQETRLLGLGLDLAASTPPDIIVGWYFQPYGVAACLLGKAINKPVVLVHAGSDIGRLSKEPELGSVYRWMVGENLLITHNEQTRKEVLITLGEEVDKNTQTLRRAKRIDTWFRRKGKSIDFARYANVLSHWYSDLRINPKYKYLFEKLPSAPNNEAFVISSYGKLGESKGTLSLMEAFLKLIQSGRKAHLVMTLGGHGRPIDRVLSFIDKNTELHDCVTLLPFIAPWRVPELIRASHVVCFLENNFEITFHSPHVPREVMSIGSCLVCSREVFEKYRRFMDIHNGKQVAVVDDLSDAKELSELLVKLVDNPQFATKLGISGLSHAVAHNQSLTRTDPLCLQLERMIYKMS